MRSGTRQSGTTGNTGIYVDSNRQSHSYIALGHENKGAVKREQRPAMMDSRMLTGQSPNRIPLQTGCSEKEKSSTHFLYDCEAIAYLRFHRMGHYLMERCNYHDAPIRKDLSFIRSVGLT
jgi:hypothetical protein